MVEHREYAGIALGFVAAGVALILAGVAWVRWMRRSPAGRQAVEETLEQMELANKVNGGLEKLDEAKKQPEILTLNSEFVSSSHTMGVGPYLWIPTLIFMLASFFKLIF